jgi:tetratricopeptide (TPR) repeat protein
MNPMYEFEDIDDYLHDRMSTSDRQVFEQALQTDPDLARRVEALQAETKVLRLLRDEHLLTQFADWEQELDEKKTAVGSPAAELKVVSRNWQRWIIPAAAATVVGIAAVGFSLGWFGTSPDQPQIVVENPPVIDTTTQKSLPPQTPIPPVNIPDEPATNQYAALGPSAYRNEEFKSTLMGDHPDETETNYSKAVKFYAAGKYQAALNLLQKPDSAKLQQYTYLRAYTLYNLKRYPEAEKDFRAFRKFKDSDYEFDAQWGEVFSLVPQLPAPAARKRLDAILKEMMDVDHPYHQKAVDLKKALMTVDGGR